MKVKRVTFFFLWLYVSDVSDCTLDNERKIHQSNVFHTKISSFLDVTSRRREFSKRFCSKYDQLIERKLSPAQIERLVKNEIESNTHDLSRRQNSNALGGER